MSKHVKVIVLRAAGTNCNAETAFAFSHFGAAVDQVHIKRLVAREILLSDYHILAIPGGFSYGDDIAAGRILANELRLHLREDLKRFIEKGKLILGICNGFQVLVKAGLLPGKAELTGSSHQSQVTSHQSEGDSHQQATLTANDSGRFEARWTCLKTVRENIWTKGLPEIMYLPVAHGEGKFMPREPHELEALTRENQVAFRYCDPAGKKSEYPWNPNGSAQDIAGITDSTGRILGLMPHPERHFFFTQCPAWTRMEKKSEYGDGAGIFENGMKYVKEHLI